ncbi:MAG: thiazole synthase [Gemmatimonadetes bacterium]|nr:thiazole synthase [Gemmatimonadota bacterium]
MATRNWDRRSGPERLAEPSADVDADVDGVGGQDDSTPPDGPAPERVPGGGVVREDLPAPVRKHAKSEVAHESTRVRAEGRGGWTDAGLEAAPPSLQQLEQEPLEIGGREFRSRLIVGTGKYADASVMVEALRASGAEMVTVAVRRVDLDRREGILHTLDPNEYFLLANTAGCYSAEEAIRYARLARAAGFNEWLKLEVIGDQETLLPDTQATIEAAKVLVAEGFKVMAYTNDDLVTALRLEDAGCVAVMPLASPIGSGLGVVNPYFIREIKRRLRVPVIVDAGVGTASDACLTMEQGVDGVLMNTALAAADDPVVMARAMRYAIRAGRLAYLAGRMPAREIAVPSSPLRGMLG